MGQHHRRGRGRTGGRLGTPLLAVVIAAVFGSGVVAVAIRTASRGADSCPRTGGLRVGVDPTAVDWVRDFAARYTAAHRRVDGRCVRVDVRLMSAERASAALQATPYPGAGDPPHVWIPASTALLDLVRARPANAAVLPERAPPLAASPLVVAAPADALAALPRATAPGHLLADLLLGGSGQDGWAAFGHPEWGPLRFSLVDPSTSVASTNALVGLAALATGVAPEAVTAAAFADPRVQGALLRFVRATAVRTDNVDELADQARSASSTQRLVTTLGLVVMSEQDMLRYNASAPLVPLRPTYPFGGALATDFPYVVPDGRWMTGFDRAAAADFRAWLSGPDVQEQLSTYQLRRADGGAGRALTAVGGAAAPLAPTAQRDTRVTATARGSWRLLTKRVLTLAVMDVSGSMGQRVNDTDATKLDLAVRAARNALPLYGDGDYTGLWEFSTGLDGGADHRELVPVGPTDGEVGGRPRRAALDAAYRSLTPQHGTSLYDTTLAAYEAVQAAYRPGFVNTVVVLTDGENEDARSISLEQLLSELDRRRDPDRPVHVITIAYGDRANTAVLDRIAKATGGLSFASPDPRDIGQVFLTALTSLSE